MEGTSKTFAYLLHELLGASEENMDKGVSLHVFKAQLSCLIKPQAPGDFITKNHLSHYWTCTLPSSFDQQAHTYHPHLHAQHSALHLND